MLNNYIRKGATIALRSSNQSFRVSLRKFQPRAMSSFKTNTLYASSEKMTLLPSPIFNTHQSSSEDYSRYFSTISKPIDSSTLIEEEKSSGDESAHPSLNALSPEVADMIKQEFEVRP